MTSISSRFRSFRALAGLAAAAVAVCVVSDGEAADARTRVILNGVATPVVFNDGDSFRVLGGPMTGAKSRLSGFNTMESHGPVHVWGTWTAHELYVIAKIATYNARDNVWECTTDGKTDGYGRMLVFCPGLAKDQVKKGLAHAMSINDDPADAELLALQREAQAARRGIWAHGIPNYVLTSLHSIEEDVEGDGIYNRLVSSYDGHSVKWKHESKYDECSRVCHLVYSVDEGKVGEVVAQLKREQAPLVAGLDDAKLTTAVREFARHHHVTVPVPAAQQPKLQALLLEWAAKGAFGAQQASEEACMVHVDFKRRYGGSRATCLRSN
jgi:endonuclease YncB( thermonuclease family)